jgi:hypothetical protein
MTHRFKWSLLSTQQVGRYAKYFVKMEFTLYGFDVYTAEVDDKGIDFVIRKDNKYYDIQVKSARKFSYIFFDKEKFKLRSNLLASIVLFRDDEFPRIFLVPSAAWNELNALFVSNDYPGKKSRPEWGMNLSQRNMALLEPFRFEDTIKSL